MSETVEKNCTITFIGGPYNGWVEKYEHDNFNAIVFCDEGGISHTYHKLSPNTYVFKETRTCKQKWQF